MIPEIRFKSFQSSESWELKNIGNFLKERNEQAPEDSKYPLMGFLAGKGVAPKGERYDRSFLVKSENKNYKRTELWDFIYSSNNLESGSIGLNRYGFASISPVYSIFKTDVRSHPNFLSEFIQRPKFINKMKKYRQGVVYGQWRIHERDFLKISDYFPTYPEQEMIGSFYAKLDLKINLLTKKKEALETFKKGLMQKIFSQELRFKPEDGTDFPDWISVKLDDLFEIGSSKRILQEFWQEEGVPFYRTRELVSIHNRKPFNSPIFISRKTYEEVVNKYGKPKVGDILCAGVGSIGHFVKVDESFGDFYFKDGNVLIMSPKDDISTDFFLFLLYSSQIQKKIHSQSSITTVATFTITDAKRLKVLIPESSQERLRIAELLRSVTKRINLTDDRIANALELKKGLLQRMFV